MPEIPRLTIPDELFSLTEWLLTDPNSGQVAVPFLSELLAKARGQTDTVPYYYQASIGGTPHLVGHRNVPLEMLGFTTALDQYVAPFLDWFTDEDPRARIQAATQASFQEALAKAGGDPYMIEMASLPYILGMPIAREATKDKLLSYGITDPAQQNQIYDALFGKQANLWQANSALQGMANQNVPVGSPLRPLLDTLSADLGNWWQPGYFDDPGFGLQTTDAVMRDLLTDAGYSIAAGNTGNGGSNVPETGGVQPTPLNYFAPFLELAAGGRISFDDKGNPIFSQQSQQQWLDRYGASGLFGPAQLQAIQSYLTPRPLTSQEQAARDMLSGTKPQDALNQALATLNGQVLPGLQNLANTGFRTPTPDLFSPEQYGLVQDFARTGNKDFLGGAAQDIFAKRLMPKVAEAYSANLGTGGSDFMAELARQGELLAADIAPLINQNTQYGMSTWNDMSSTQGLLDSQLSEAAAARRANALPMLGNWSTYAAQLPLTFAQDLSNIGGAFRASDEANSSAKRAMDLFQFMLTGASPNNLGYVAQGQLPSATTSLLTGQAAQSAAFAPAMLNGFGGGIFSQALGGLGSTLGRNLFSGGGFDNNGNFGFLGDLGGLLGSGLSSIWSGIGSLFGGGGSSSFDSNNWGGGSGGDFWNWA